MRSSTSPGDIGTTSFTAASRWSRRWHVPRAWDRQPAAPSCSSTTPTTPPSGATQDTMYVLKEALRQELTGIAVGPVRDPRGRADGPSRRGREGDPETRW